MLTARPDTNAERDLLLDGVLRCPSLQQLHTGSLTDAAVHYDRNRDSIIMKAFEGKAMEPHVFKMQLARAFAIRLNEKEIAALVHFFDKVRGTSHGPPTRISD